MVGGTFDVTSEVGEIEQGAAGRGDVEAPIASAPLIATSVRFLALSFFMMLRRCTLTVLSHMLSSKAITLFGLP